jgi:V8-like Glu-specific endopeptidase
MRFHSRGAYSLNYAFSELALSPEAELYVFSSDGSMVYGPVTATQNTTDGWFYTIPVCGEDGVIQLIEPASAKGQSRLTVSQVVHGYKNVTPSQDGPLTLLSCHNDVCNYSAWTDYSDAVCRILVSGTAICTGALMNNTGPNYMPYVLTANHCLGGDGNPGPTGWTFQFRYKSCATSVSFNYADTKATWNRESGTDFLLVQLRSSLADQNLTFLGWDRTNTTPSSGTGIHHPTGAQMKISFAESTLSSNTNYWFVNYNLGTTEGGSSGSPLFNPAKRVIGQLWGGYAGCPDPTIEKQYGRLDRSWTGGGTASTRLQDWLDLDLSGAQTLNLIPMFNISGPSLVPCTGTVTYTIPQTRKTGISSITWSTGSQGIQIVSGQGTSTITVQAVTSTSASGNIMAILTYGGVTKVISKSVSIGAPTITGISGPSTATTGSYVTYYATPDFPASQGDYDWFVSTSSASKSPYRRMCDITFTASGTFGVGVRSTSACTSPGTYTMMTVSVGSRYIASSGLNKQVSVAISTLEGAPVVTDPNQTIAYDLYNQATGAPVTSGRISAQGGTLDFSFVPEGIYLLRLDAGNGTFDTHRVLLK